MGLMVRQGKTAKKPVQGLHATIKPLHRMAKLQRLNLELAHPALPGGACIKMPGSCISCASRGLVCVVVVQSRHESLPMLRLRFQVEQHCDWPGFLRYWPLRSPARSRSRCVGIAARCSGLLGRWREAQVKLLSDLNRDGGMTSPPLAQLILAARH